MLINNNKNSSKVTREPIKTVALTLSRSCYSDIYEIILTRWDTLPPPPFLPTLTKSSDCTGVVVQLVSTNTAVVQYLAGSFTTSRRV